MATAVVYYSATGNCALAARALAEKLGAKLVELKETKTRDMSKVNFAFMTAGFRAVLGVRARLKGQPWLEAADCDEIHILTPIWASRPAPAVNAFVARYDFSGKRVHLYTVQADPNDTAKPARDKLAARISAKGAAVAGAHGLTGGAPGQEPKAELAESIVKIQ